MTLQYPLQFDHYGNTSATITDNLGNLDSRSLVALLNRNIRMASDSST